MTEPQSRQYVGLAAGGIMRPLKKLLPPEVLAAVHNQLR